MVATDSYRLCVKQTALEPPVQSALEVNVPARALQELVRIASATDTDTLSVSRGSNQVIFELGDTVLSSRLIDGQFPNYRQLLPDSVDHELRMSTTELGEVVRRISLLAQKNAPLRLSFSEGTLTVSAQTPDIGEASEAIPVPFHGELFEIGFNPEFLQGRAREHRVPGARAEADQPAAPRRDRNPRDGRLRVPDHADPPERVTPWPRVSCPCRCATFAATRARKPPSAAP